MDYPRQPENIDLRKKLTQANIFEMTVMFKNGFSKRHIARVFDISVGSVCYHLNGLEYKNKWNDNVKNRIKSLSGDPIFQEKRKEADRKYKKRKRDLLPEFNKYCIEITKKWYSKSDENRNKWRENARKWRLKQATTN
jgi:hypothetical protein